MKTGYLKIAMCFSILITAAVMLSFCRNDPDPEKPAIEKILFEESNKTVHIGETVNVKLKIEPAAAKSGVKVEYRTSQNDIVAIKKESNADAVVFEAQKGGNVVIIARAEGMVAYCSVTVNSIGDMIIPHIITPFSVLECHENERRSITVSLAGGTPADNSGFVWSCSNSKSIIMETTGNVAVIDAVTNGESLITVSHPKAQYSVNIPVFVSGTHETPMYVTTEHNVINLQKTEQNYQFNVELRGGGSEDNSGFIFEVVDGSDVIDLFSGSNIGTINPKSKGTARIGVSHPQAQYRLEIVVIVNETEEYRYVETDKNLVILNQNENTTINARFIGQAPDDIDSHYTFTSDNEAVAAVSQTGNACMVFASAGGKAVVTVTNTYSDFVRKVLVIVNTPDIMLDNEIYISTSQNVITMEAEGGPVTLRMFLSGGNEADNNNFIWTVDDSTIIDAETTSGKMVYSDKQSRTAVNTGTGPLEAAAIITAKKVGTAKIILENPKAKNSCAVVVKVYKKGTFSTIPLVMEGLSLYKGRIGEAVPVYLHSAGSGNLSSIQNVSWMTEHENIAGVTGTGLSGVLEGRKNGITTLRVSGDNFKHDFTAVVIIGSDEYLENTPVIHVVNPFITLIKGESYSFKVMYENMTADSISVANNDKNIIDVFDYRGSITVTALENGTGEIIISADNGNTVTVTVTVEEYAVNPEMPYYLRSDKAIYGVVKGRTLEITVDLAGSGEAQQGSILWNSSGGTIISVTGNGRTGRIMGMNTGQALITVSHPKSNNILEIAVYVVEDESGLRNKVALYVKENNILLGIGEERYITILTNADDEQKRDIQWDISSADIIDVSVSGDKIKALVKGRSPGVTNIFIKHHDNLTQNVIYISVVYKTGNGVYINVPSIVETVAGDSVAIQAVTDNISDMYNIRWKNQNENIISIHENGGQCLVKALETGTAVITVEYAGTGYVKNVLVFVYAGIPEMTGSYVMAGEQTRYTINKGDVINTSLLFGIKGFPEHEIRNIQWLESGNNVVEVTGNGKTANIRGLNKGIGIVTARSAIANDVMIEIEVRENTGILQQYRFNITEQDRMIGLTVNQSKEIVLQAVDGSNVMHNPAVNCSVEYVENKGAVSAEIVENVLLIKATGVGKCYIRLWDEQGTVEETRILVYTAMTPGELAMEYPVMVDTVNYLLKEGEHVTVTVTTRDNDPAQLHNISYALEHGSGAVSIAEKNKRELIVRGNRKGNDVIVIRYNGSPVGRVYVSVTDNKYGEQDGYILTENIIALTAGSSRETTVVTNSTGPVMWINQENIVNVAIKDDTSAVLYGNTAGRSFITVQAGNIERRLLVIVCGNEDELKKTEAINVEQTYYKVKKGSNAVVNIFSYKGNVGGETIYSDYYNNNDEYGNVIAVNSTDNNKISVKGLNEGVAVIRITNNAYQAEFVVYVEVTDSAEGSVNPVSNTGYLTANKTLYVIGQEESNVLIDVIAAGTRLSNDGVWSWTGYDEKIIQVTDNGGRALVNPLQEGQTIITVSHTECTGNLRITVIVGERYTAEKVVVPYIYMEKDIFEAAKSDRSLRINYTLMNVEKPDYNTSVFETYDNGIQAENIRGQSAFIVHFSREGIYRVDVKYGEMTKDVYIIVKDDSGSQSSGYLTTGQNLVIATVNELTTIDVSLRGIDDIDRTHYKWEIQNENIAQLIGNGASGQLYARNPGKTVVNVSHTRVPNQKLAINVEVVNGNEKQNAVYLTTQTNIIETVAGDNLHYVNVQKIGGDIADTRCNWSTAGNTGVIELSGSGLNAAFVPRKEGTAKIAVYCEENPKYPLEILVIVKKGNNNGIYISSENNLILMSPGETGKRVSVSLVNGDEKDYNQFTWSVYANTPADIEAAKMGSNVVSFTANKNEATINALIEGVYIIRVEHKEKAYGRPYHITVYVSYHQSIQFSTGTKDIITGDSDIAGINIPNYQYMKDKVKVTSSDTGVCDVFYTNDVVLLSGKKPGNVIIKAWITGNEGEAQLSVNVVDQFDPEVNRVVVGKSIYNTSPNADPLKLEAVIAGIDFIERENDNIWWSADIGGIVSFFPCVNQNDIDKTPGKITAPVSKGKVIQVSPQKTGTVRIKIGHDYVDERYYKEIVIIVSERNDKFNISPAVLKLDDAVAGSVRADIYGGTAKDYSAIKWNMQLQHKWDGSYLEIARVMGSGREITLYPMHTGTADLIATYGNQQAVCTVEVVSEYYFNFRNSNERMYPGEVRDLSFDIKPANSIIHWIGGNDYSDPAAAPVVSYDEILGSAQEDNQDNILKVMRITALREGITTVSGLANGKLGTVTIKVAYDYQMEITRQVSWTPRYYNSSHDQNNGIKVIDYTVYPPDTHIKAENNITGLIVDIGKPGPDGKGIITLTADKEIRGDLHFILCKKDLDTDGNSIPVLVNDEKIGRSVSLRCYFPDPKITPYFVRGTGEWSNLNSSGVKNAAYGKSGGEVLSSVKGVNDLYTLTLGDGENHYILFDKNYKNAEINIKSVSIVGGNIPLLNNKNQFEAVRCDQVEFEHNGIKEKAVRISGGRDYIEYNRALLDKKLFVEVKSPAYEGRAEVYKDDELWADTIYAYDNYQTGGSVHLWGETITEDVEDSGPQRSWFVISPYINLKTISRKVAENDNTEARYFTDDDLKRVVTISPGEGCSIRMRHTYEGTQYTSYIDITDTSGLSQGALQYIDMQKTKVTARGWDGFSEIVTAAEMKHETRYVYSDEIFNQMKKYFNDAGITDKVVKDAVHRYDDNYFWHTGTIYGPAAVPIYAYMVTELVQGGYGKTSPVTSVSKKGFIPNSNFRQYSYADGSADYQWQKKILADYEAKGGIDAGKKFPYDMDGDGKKEYITSRKDGKNILPENVILSFNQYYIRRLDTDHPYAEKTTKYDVFGAKYVNNDGIRLINNGLKGSEKYRSGNLISKPIAGPGGEVKADYIVYQGMLMSGDYYNNDKERQQNYEKAAVPVSGTGNTKSTGGYYRTSEQVKETIVNSNYRNGYTTTKTVVYTNFIPSTEITNNHIAGYPKGNGQYYYKNRESYNIFGSDEVDLHKSIGGQWSRKYYSAIPFSYHHHYDPSFVMGIIHDIFGGGDCNCGDCTGWAYNNSNLCVEQRYIWEQDSGGMFTVPYYALNYFPFRYQDKQGIYGDKDQWYHIVNLKENSTPMPSVNKNLKKAVDFTVRVTYDIFDYGQIGEKEHSIDIKVQYQQRACHAEYTGNIKDEEVHYIKDMRKGREYQGAKTDWKDKTKLTHEVSDDSDFAEL